jgi:acetoin utilization deacetylase AcuC-like enzyme
MKTGVFFREEFRAPSWPVIGNKFRSFPGVMEEALSLPNVVLFKPEPVPEELLLRVHTKGHVESVKARWYYRGAALSVGGCVEAGEKLAAGELLNALVFDVAAGHHASPAYAWGGTYLSCLAPTVANIRDKFGHKRFAILDTDSHHGDGTRAMFKGDHGVLHVCFCSSNVVEDGDTKIDVNVGRGNSDEEYLGKVRAEFMPRVREFKPFIIFHNLGHDTCQGDYGDRGVSPQFFPQLVAEIKECADEVCEGRYLVLTHGGARADVAEYIFPCIVKLLAGKTVEEVT